MSATYIIAGQIIDTVVYDEVELVESAELGQIGQSSILIDDPTGTIEIVGLKRFIATESACDPDKTLRGFVGDRTYERGVAEASNSRQIRVNVNDLNDLLAQRVITTKEAKRPKETVHKRVQWLLSTDALGDLVTEGRYQRSDEMMDKADHRNTYPGDVLAECALAAGGYNYYVYQDDNGDARLSFRDDNASSSNTSIIRVSNILASQASNTFFPMDDATLTRNPESVYSRVAYPYARGTVVESRAATASNYHRKDGVAPNSNVRSAERASKQARHFLREHKTEEDMIECEIEVPAGAVNLVRAGDVIAAQFGHFGPEGYATWNNFRVRETRKKPLLRDAPPAVYRIHMRLSPQENSEPASTCGYELTAAGTYYPMGFEHAEDGWNWQARPSDGVTYYLRPGLFYPTVPTPGHVGNWNFPSPLGGLEGVGAIDYAGDCASNELRFIVVGAGTMTIQTRVFEGSTRPMAASWGPSPGGSAHAYGSFTSGEEIEITIEEDCVNLVRLSDGPGSPCGGKWGWSSMVWTPA